MKIESLRINNFRRFYGEHRIKFSIDEKKPFTIIHAENGTGKTNLLNAINWVLYGSMLEGTRGANEIINTTHILEKKSSAYAEIRLSILDDNNEIIKFIRRKTNKKDSVLKAYQGDEEIPVADRNIKKNIEALIPKELSRYFFFHGEGIKNLTNDADNIKRAVQDIQGITDAIKVLEEITRSKNIIYGKIKKSASASTKLIELNEKIKDYDKLITKATGEKNNSIEKRDAKNSQIDTLNKILRESNVELVKSQTVLKLDAEKNLRKLKTAHDNHSLKKFTASQEYYKNIINLPIAKSCKSILEGLEADGALPADLTDGLLDKIIEREECICGSTVKAGSKEFKNLQNWRDLAASAELTARVLGFDKYNAYLEDAKKFNSVMENYEEAKKRFEDDIEKQQKQFNDADEFLRKNKDSDVSDLTNEVNKLSGERNELNKDIETITNNITRYESLKAPIQRDHSKELEKSTVDVSIKTQSKFLKVAETRLGKMLESYEKEAEEFVKERINEYFDKFATKNFKVDFDENFLPILKEKNIGNTYTTAPDSDGEMLLKNIAFVCSLIEFSNKRNAQRGTSFQIEGIRPPFVVDAPFGDADGRYTGAIANILNNCGSDQIIIFLSKKHYKGSFEKITNNLKNVGKRYIIENYATKKDTLELDDIENNKHITINGKKHKQIFNTKEFGYSKIKAI